MCVCMYVCMNVWVFMYVCMCVYVHTNVFVCNVHTNVCVCTYECMCVMCMICTYADFCLHNEWVSEAVIAALWNRNKLAFMYEQIDTWIYAS